MRRRTLLFAIAILAITLAASASGQTRIDILDERIVTPPRPGPLEDQYVYGYLTLPLWSGEDWIVSWFDYRAIAGGYAQRIGADGAVAFTPNLYLGDMVPTALMHFGTGYLMQHSEGLLFLDDSFEAYSGLRSASGSVAVIDDTALSWTPQDQQLRLIRDDEIDYIPLSDVAGGEVSGLVLTPGDAEFLATWREPMSTGLWYFNLIGTDGEVLLPEPGRIPETVEDGAIAWDGAQFVLAWTSSGPHERRIRITTIDRDGTTGQVTAAVTSTTTAFSHPRLVRTAPGTLLLTWVETGYAVAGQRTRGMVIEQGVAQEGTVTIADRHVRVSSNGADQLAMVDLYANIRLASWSDALPLTDASLTPTTDWIQLRRGSRDTRSFKLADSSVAIWTRGTPGMHSLEIGVLPPGARVVESTLSIPGAFGANLASNGTTTLVVWEREEEGSPPVPAVMALGIDPHGEPTGEVIRLADGRAPNVSRHGDGWIVTWTASGLLHFMIIGPNGAPASEAQTVATPIPEEYGHTDQTNPELVSTGPATTLLLWQEGDFQFVCRITCPVMPSLGKIRSVIIDDGVVEVSTLRTYESPVAQVQPSVANRGDRILLTFLRQSGPGEELIGLFLDTDGTPTGEPFLISDDVGYDYPDNSPMAIPLGERFAVVWSDQTYENLAYSDVHAAIVSDGATPEVRQFLVSGEWDGGRIPFAAPLSPSSFTVFYTRPVAGGDYGGTWQIGARQVTIDVPSTRRRATR